MTVATPAVTAWIAANAVTLKDVRAGAGFEDLAPLKPWIGDARAVGLGEATHDTREFFQLKHRMFEFLVSELGFTLFTIEAPFPESLEVNRYVVTGEGDARHALTSMNFYCWDTEEVVELIEWMRGWNASHERKVFFYGFDIQSAKSAVIFLLDYVKRRDPRTYRRVLEPLQPLALDMHIFDRPHRAALENEQARAALADVTATLAALEAGSPQEHYELRIARLQAVILSQNDNLWTGGTLASAQIARDNAMAENVLTLLDIHGPDSKAVVWAHNGHIALQSSGQLGIKHPTLGENLRVALGKQYVTFGLAFDHGSFGILNETRRMYEYTVSSEPETLDAVFAAAGPPLFAMDLRAVPREVDAWLVQGPASRSFGGMYYPGVKLDPWTRCDIRTQFDALLFVRKTSAARHNPDTPYQTEFLREDPPARGPLVNLDFGAGTEGWRRAQGNLGYQVAVVARETGKVLEISRSAAFWQHDVFALSQAASAAPWRGRRITIRCSVSMEAAHHGSSAQLAVRVLGPLRKQVEVADIATQKFVWQRAVTRDAQARELSLTLDVRDTAETLGLALLITGDGLARFGPIVVEDGGETTQKE